MTTTEDPSIGPFAYENWKIHETGTIARYSVEYPLFSDAHIIGNDLLDYGPYDVINTVARDDSRGILPSLVLRTNDHLEYKSPDWSKTNDETYHGGYL